MHPDLNPPIPKGTAKLANPDVRPATSGNAQRRRSYKRQPLRPFAERTTLPAIAGESGFGHDQLLFKSGVCEELPGRPQIRTFLGERRHSWFPRENRLKLIRHLQGVKGKAHDGTATLSLETFAAGDLAARARFLVPGKVRLSLYVEPFSLPELMTPNAAASVSGGTLLLRTEKIPRCIYRPLDDHSRRKPLGIQIDSARPRGSARLTTTWYVFCIRD